MDGIGLVLASAHPAHLPPQGSHPSAPGSSQAGLESCVSRPKESEPRLPSTLPFIMSGNPPLPQIMDPRNVPAFQENSYV